MYCYVKFDRLSKNPTCSHNLNIFLFTQQCPRNGPPTFEPSVVCSFGTIVLDSRKSKVIDLYSDYTENKLQALTFAAITSVWTSLQCCNLAYNVHHGSAHQPRYSISPVDTCAYGYEGGLVEETMTILFTFTAS